MQKLIVGAGLAGLIAACKFKHVPIVEAGKRMEQHKALLRFRDKSVSELTGIPFQEVVVHKEIYYEGESYQNCTIKMANMYSQKVSGKVQGRSIWNLDTVKRYVAPDDLYDQLVDRHIDRINWQAPLERAPKNKHLQIISTMPLPAMMKACGMDEMKFEFSKSPIKVTRYRLPVGTKAYQTIYFPDPSLRIFRVSITGDMLIIESMTGQPNGAFDWSFSDPWMEHVHVAEIFGLADLGDLIDAVDQKYGKIVELPRELREAILYELTRDFNVFSLGRFATYRNILLDDVVKDIHVIEKLMAASSYGRGLVLAGH